MIIIIMIVIIMKWEIIVGEFNMMCVVRGFFSCIYWADGRENMRELYRGFSAYAISSRGGVGFKRERKQEGGVFLGSVTFCKVNLYLLLVFKQAERREELGMCCILYKIYTHLSPFSYGLPIAIQPTCCRCRGCIISASQHYQCYFYNPTRS